MTGGAETSAGEVVQLALHSTEGRVALVATVAASAMASSTRPWSMSRCRTSARTSTRPSADLQWVLTGYLRRAGVVDPPRRRARRPLRAPQGLRDRHGVVRRWRRCSAASRPTSRSSSPRACCRASAARLLTPGQPGDPAGELPRAGPGHGRGRVVRPRRRRRRDRPVRRRVPRRRARLAVGVPHQRARRRARDRLRPRVRSPRSRDPDAGGRLDLVGAGTRRGQPGREHVGAHREPDRAGWTDPRRSLGRRRRRGRSASSRSSSACCTAARSARPAGAVPRPHVHRHEPADRSCSTARSA